jgi:hypothetical protein
MVPPANPMTNKMCVGGSGMPTQEVDANDQDVPSTAPFLVTVKFMLSVAGM